MFLFPILLLLDWWLSSGSHWSIRHNLLLKWTRARGIVHSSRGTTSQRVWQCGTVDRLFSTYLCKYFVTLTIYHLCFFATEWENYNGFQPTNTAVLVIFISAVMSGEGLEGWWELIMHFISMMDTTRSTQNYISPENWEKSASLWSQSFEKCCHFSLSEDETSVTPKRKTFYG